MALRFLKKILPAVAIVTIIANLTMTSASFSFTGKQPESPAASKTFIESVGDVINQVDFLDEDAVSGMVESLTGKAKAYALETDSLEEFQKASLVRVIDGDTIVVEFDNKEEYTVRMIGINTPESVASKEYLDKINSENSKAGEAASEFTKNLLSNYEFVYLQKDVSEQDDYGRLLRYVWLDIPTNDQDLSQISTEMLNAILVKEGVAEVATYYPDVEYSDEFEELDLD